jgi:hypothetical protein
MNKFGCFVTVHGLNLSLCVLNIRTLNLKILDEHFRYFEERKYIIEEKRKREAFMVTGCVVVLLHVVEDGSIYREKLQ